MKKDERGFTLLEVIMAFLLFGILTTMLWDFFTGSYIQALKQERQTILMNQAQTVRLFIQEEIRLSEKISIIVVTDAGSEVTIEPGDESTLSDKTKGTLKEIKLDTNSSGAKGKRSIRKIKNTADTANKGMYQLVYTANKTDNPICTNIKEIEIVYEKQSKKLECNCLYEYKLAGNVVETKEDSFIITFQYKDKY